MVAKIHLGNSLYGALNYNGEKINKENGRLLDTNKIYNDGTGHVDIKRAYADFMQWMPSTTKTERPMVHISLNPHPDDVLTDAQLTEIAREYMERMGFGEMPYMVYKHTDINRHHLHIVALRVRTDGSCISDKNNFYRSKEITRSLEQKYGLKTAERDKVTPDTPLLKIDPAGALKRQVASAVKIIGMRYRFRTIGEYNAVLGLFNIRCEQTDGRVNGREYHGLIYFALDDTGHPMASPFKASRLGKFAGREAIEAKFKRSEEKMDVGSTKKVVAEVLVSSADKEEFVAALKEQGIDVVFRYTDEGRIYGATFVDHNTFNVLNGSRLGKEFSANALNERFNGKSDTSVERLHQNPGSNQEQPHQTNPNTKFQPGPQREEYQIDGILPDFDLFQPGQSYNPDEEEFIRRMKRKRRRGRQL